MMWSKKKKNHLDPTAHIPFDVSAVSSLPREKGTALKNIRLGILKSQPYDSQFQA